LRDLRGFHSIDRDLYRILVKDLERDRTQSLYTMALWLWLERREFCRLVTKILPLPPSLINELADEALICLRCLDPRIPPLESSNEIPLTQGLITNREISLPYFLQNRSTGLQQIEAIVTGVCIPAFSDVAESTTARSNESCSKESDRTMFATFSKGYPVTENEVREFFNIRYGDCIYSLSMQPVDEGQQPLYATIVFQRVSFIHAILNGARKAKFTINGKHVWMRKFIPKTNSSSSSSSS
ncbi:hypothetical protein M569_04070, partial [Genlisea aurea]